MEEKEKVMASNFIHDFIDEDLENGVYTHCLLYTSPSPRDGRRSRMPSSA